MPAPKSNSTRKKTSKAASSQRTSKPAPENDADRSGPLPEGVAEPVREVWLAGLGALATVEKEGARLFNTLVERGQGMEAEGKSRIESTKENLSARQKETAGRLEENVYGSVRTAMERLGVPTRTEMDALSKQVDVLSKKLDALTAMLEARTSAPKID